MRRLGSFHPLFAPIESVKDQSLLKGEVLALALFVGHPVYYLAWSRWFPQPYENLTLRLVCSVLGALAFLAIRRYGASDPRAGVIYGVATAAGTVVLAAWFYVANGGDPVWLASLAAMTMVYFSMTDWRIAVVVTLLSYALAYLLVPALKIGAWDTGEPFGPGDWLILGFCLGVSLLTRYTDTSMRVVQLKSQLRALGITAHEIRTPLAGMQLLSTTLEERLNEARPGRIEANELGAMRSLARELVETCRETNSLIDTHLANANPFKPFSRRDTVSVAAAAHDAVSTFRRGAGVEGPLVNVEVRRDFTILAEAGAIRQVLVNLLTNAFKAVVLRHRVAGPNQISVLVDFDGGGRVTIADEGAGIPEQELSRIFEPFHTGDSLHGHGLGLTFVRSAVSAYGGTIAIAGNEHGGTTMTICFPKAQAL